MRKETLIAVAALGLTTLAGVPSRILASALDGINPAPASLGEVYAFPNPAVGGSPVTFHAEIDEAVGAAFRVYTTAGELVHEVQVSGDPSTFNGGRGYEVQWNPADHGLASGPYFFSVHAQRQNASDVSATKTFLFVR